MVGGRTTTVRRLAPGDEALYSGMLDVFGEAFEDRASYGEARPGLAYVARLLAKDTFIAAVALDGERVVGAIAAYVLEKFEQERSEGYIYDLAVLETHRRRGLATALIEEVKRVSAERGAWVVYVQADHGDEPAIALYTKLGIREDVLHFDIPIGAARSPSSSRRP